MPTGSPEPSTGGLLGPDPGRTIRVWVALLLRLGIGLSLLSTGLVGYFGMRMAGRVGNPWAQWTSMSMLDPFLSGLPYLAIAIGLALILGFLTTPAAIAAGLFSLIVPAMAIVQLAVSGAMGGGGRGSLWGGNPQLLESMMTISLPNLLTNAAMIWLSPLENHPYSVDALIFGKNEIEPGPPPGGPFHVPEPAVAEGSPIHIGE